MVMVTLVEGQDLQTNDVCVHFLGGVGNANVAQKTCPQLDIRFPHAARITNEIPVLLGKAFV